MLVINNRFWFASGFVNGDNNVVCTRNPTKAGSELIWRNQYFRLPVQDVCGGGAVGSAMTVKFITADKEIRT